MESVTVIYTLSMPVLTFLAPKGGWGLWGGRFAAVLEPLRIGKEIMQSEGRWRYQWFMYVK